MNDSHLERAHVLIAQDRHEQAESELRKALAQDPDDPEAHAWLALCLGKRDLFIEATQEAETAVRLAPDLAIGHYYLAWVLLLRNHLPEAQLAIRDAIMIEPLDADHYALLGQIHLLGNDWRQALEAADHGLSLNAENQDCLRVRARSLINMRRTEEAEHDAAALLALDPDESENHVNQGFVQLHRGKYEEALEHFTEALRLEPGSEAAKIGLVEALKARNTIYGLILRYFLWAGTLGVRVQVGIMIGGYFGYQFLLSVAKDNAALRPWLSPILAAYIVFVVMTWIASPLFDLVLRFSRYGRHALSRDQRAATTWLAILLVGAVISAGTYFIGGIDEALLALLYSGFLMLPVTSIFSCERGWPRHLMTAYVCGLALCMPASIFVFAYNRSLSNLLSLAFLYSGLVSPFICGWLRSARPRR